MPLAHRVPLLSHPFGCAVVLALQLSASWLCSCYLRLGSAAVFALQLLSASWLCRCLGCAIVI